jgi:tRNA G26 N,N-dimethylase Trm1
MPYVDQATRDCVDALLGELCTDINSVTGEDTIEGMMNYVITSLLNRCMIGDEPRYKKINRAMGVLECVKQEFYRRLAIPYENGAVAKNGDMPCYSGFFPIQ